MAKDDWLLAGLLACGVGLVYSLKNRCTPLVQKGSRVILFGDSLSVGLNRYLKKLASQEGAEYDAFVQGGTAMFQWLGRGQYGTGDNAAKFSIIRSAFYKSLETFKPTIVLICLGTNDSHPWSKGIWPSIPSDVDKTIKMITDAGAQPFWILPPKLVDWDENVSPVVRTKDIPVFESAQFPIKMGPDRIHPTGEGYAAWAGGIWRQLTCGKVEPDAPVPAATGRTPTWLTRSSR